MEQRNGFEVALPSIGENKIPSVYALLEATWMFAAIVQGIRIEVWEGSYPVHFSVLPLFDVWRDMGLIITDDTNGGDIASVGVKLSKAGKAVVAAKDLWEYEFSMLEQQLDADFVTDPSKYKKLRGALASYSEHFIPEMHTWVQSFATGKDINVMDFGGGDGAYLKSLLTKNPTASGVLYDKAPGVDLLESSVAAQVSIIHEDFKRDPKFILTSKEQFDIIIASEVLHVLGPHERGKVYKELNNCLKPNGILLIIEQNYNVRLDWRLFDMTENGRCIEAKTLLPEFDTKIFDIHALTNRDILTATHYGFAIKKRVV